MKIKKIIFIAILSFTMLELYAIVLPPEVWLTGNIHLKDGRILSGKLQCQMGSNVILYLSDDGIRTYPAILIKSFELHDNESGDSKIYYAIPAEVNEVNDKTEFYEVITAGKLTLLCREKLIRKVWPKGRGLVKVNRFYYMDYNHMVKPLETSEKNIALTMEDHLVEINSFIRRHNLKMHKKLHLQQVFAYYNGLVKSNK